jgi:uncharacterized protein YqhQ
MKPSGIGGMAVMEGVMMKNKDEYAVAVRKPDNEIVVEKNTHKDFSDRVKLFKLPIFRGMLAFVDSMVVGIKVLNYSASFFEDDDAQTQNAKSTSKKQNNKKTGKEESKQQNKKAAAKDADFDIEAITASNVAAEAVVADDKVKDNKTNAILMVFAVFFSIALSIGLFMVLPAFIIELLKKVISNHFMLSLIEGLLRLAIFIGYVVLASLMSDIKRVFMYHGAEHKTINCLENGFELTVENVRWQSKQHKRCGTSFMLLVILISLLMFMIFPTTGLFWRVISRILLVPFIAGISYEFIRLAGKSDNAVVNVISKPGLWMQGLTTREPDDSMIEVAIKSVESVFDWRAFLANNKDKTKESKNDIKKHKTADKPDGTQTKPEVKDNVNTNVASDKSETAAALNKAKGAYDIKNRNTGTATINFKDSIVDNQDDEDDEILVALDKYFDNGKKEQGKAKKQK